MARLFIGAREQQMINDWTKEFIKDVVGQYILYYPVSILKTRVHPVYDEAIEKIFDNPVKVDCLVDQPQQGQTIGAFSLENATTLDVYIQNRDLLDKGYDVDVGDFFLYGNEVFEILSYSRIGDVFGQAEYNVYIKLSSKLARSGRFDLPTFKQFLEDGKKFSNSAVEKVFEQQRGFGENVEGGTGDVRQVRERLADDMAPIALGTGPKRVATDDPEDKSDTDGEDSSSSFYNE
jgi:hypothetical protein